MTDIKTVDLPPRRILPKPAHSSIEWQRLRHRDDSGRVVFGASEAPALMDRSQYESRADLCHRKLTDPRTSEPSPAMLTGNLLEPVLVDEASRRLGIELVTPDLMFARDRFVATPDAIDRVSADMATGLLAVDAGAQVSPELWVEVKTTSRYRVRSLDDVPEAWRWQMATQRWVVGVPVYLIVLDCDHHINVFETPDSWGVEALLVDTARELGSMLDRGVIPPDDYDRLSDTQVADLFGPTDEAVELSADAMTWVLALEDARATKKQAETQEQEARDHLARLLRGATTGTLDGQRVVSWREQAGRRKLDVAALTTDHPELVEQYMTTGAPYRVMRLHGKS